MIRIVFVFQILASLSLGCQVVALRGDVGRLGHELAQFIDREVELRAAHQELELILSEESMPSRLRDRAAQMNISLDSDSAAQTGIERPVSSSPKAL
ncbi:MAG: hypothetical protein O3B01_19490 [Planctomycetota bacterium]|nr:hypothetical protein [Planctomycetota bacterium]MDA1140755.1 hypothetical protein [Planctomycetota bacterium]